METVVEILPEISSDMKELKEEKPFIESEIKNMVGQRQYIFTGESTLSNERLLALKYNL